MFRKYYGNIYRKTSMLESFLIKLPVNITKLLRTLMVKVPEI